MYFSGSLQAFASLIYEAEYPKLSETYKKNLVGIKGVS